MCLTSGMQIIIFETGFYFLTDFRVSDPKTHTSLGNIWNEDTKLIMKCVIIKYNNF